MQELVRLGYNQEVRVKVAATRDNRGRDATFDGVPEWSVEGDAAVDVEPSDDGKEAVIRAGDVDGIALVVARGTATYGQEEVPMMAVRPVLVASYDTIVADFTTGVIRDPEKGDVHTVDTSTGQEDQ